MRKFSLLLTVAILLSVVGIVQAAVIIDDDFDNATVSAANWNVSTYGAVSTSSVYYNTEPRLSEVKLGLTCSPTGSLGEVEITNKTGISAANAAAGPITQALTLGSYQNGGSGELWLIGDDGSSGTFDRNATSGGYIRVVWNYSSNAVSIYARGKGDSSLQALLSTSVTDLEENDVFTVTYNSSNVASLTFYDASLDTTSNLVSSPIAHGLDFAVDYANGAYTALALYTYSNNIVTYHAVEVTGVSEPLLAGDANRDGIVSADDYVFVQYYFSDTGVSGILGDANGDGVVDADDYTSVQDNYGNIAPVEVTPEPATMSLLALGGLCLIRRRRK